MFNQGIGMVSAKNEYHGKSFKFRKKEQHAQ